MKGHKQLKTYTVAYKAKLRYIHERNEYRKIQHDHINLYL